MRTLHASSLALLASAAIVLGGAAAASATDPVDLGDARVVDQVDALTSGEERSLDERLRSLRHEAGVDLWVVYVDEFTNPSDSEQWATDVADNAGLDADDYLLVVATETSMFYLSGAENGPVDWSDLTLIENDAILPELQAGDFGGAAFAAAGALSEAAGGSATDGGASGSGGSGTWLTIALGGAALIAVIAVVIVVVVRRRSRSGSTSGTSPAVPTAELARRSAAALVAADDALKTSEQELGFASAQFGDASTTAFAATLTQARTDLDEAFALQQQLDDDQPDTEEQVRGIHERIIALCEHADAELDARADEFDALRALEQHAPDEFARLRQSHADASAALDDAASALVALRAGYAATELATVDDNPEQAEARLAFADEQLDAAERSLTAGDRSAAALALSAAASAIAQAVQLEKAITTVADGLAAAERDAAALIADLEHDIAAAAGVSDPDGSLATVVASAQEQVDTARSSLTGDSRRPQTAVSALLGATSALDSALAGARDAAERSARARQALDQRLQQARAQVAAAEDYIASRRGGVGAQPRTRAAEARTSLQRAEQHAQTDPETALTEASRAVQLANLAIDAARAEVSGFSQGSPGSNSNGMMGAMLGGILINSLLGGGSSRGRTSGFGSGFSSGFGGSSRSRSGGGGFGGSRSRRGGGSFGGGRSRRGGGRF